MSLKVIELGLVDFQDAWARQRELFREVKESRLRCGLIVCRHYPAITVSRRANRNNILAPPDELKNRGIGIYAVERGGDVTYHGPGQLIAYPVFNLNYFKKDIHWFLRFLEGLIIRCLEESGIKGDRVEGLTGVWAGRSKIAAIGIAVRNWITFHGLSLNVQNSDLSNFSLIRPCGMDIMVTSMETVSGKAIPIEKIQRDLVNLFKTSCGI